jgi:hypothetical protein
MMLERRLTRAYLRLPAPNLDRREAVVDRA